jgi:hypothetical protein
MVVSTIERTTEEDRLSACTFAALLILSQVPAITAHGMYKELIQYNNLLGMKTSLQPTAMLPLYL